MQGFANMVSSAADAVGDAVGLTGSNRDRQSSMPPARRHENTQSAQVGRSGNTVVAGSPVSSNVADLQREVLALRRECEEHRTLFNGWIGLFQDIIFNLLLHPSLAQRYKEILTQQLCRNLKKMDDIHRLECTEIRLPSTASHSPSFVYKGQFDVRGVVQSLWDLSWDTRDCYAVVEVEGSKVVKYKAVMRIGINIRGILATQVSPGRLSFGFVDEPTLQLPMNSKITLGNVPLPMKARLQSLLESKLRFWMNKTFVHPAQLHVPVGQVDHHVPSSSRPLVSSTSVYGAGVGASVSPSTNPEARNGSSEVVFTCSKQSRGTHRRTSGSGNALHGSDGKVSGSITELNAPKQRDALLSLRKKPSRCPRHMAGGVVVPVRDCECGAKCNLWKLDSKLCTLLGVPIATAAANIPHEIVGASKLSEPKRVWATLLVIAACQTWNVEHRNLGFEGIASAAMESVQRALSGGGQMTNTDSMKLLIDGVQHAAAVIRHCSGGDGDSAVADNVVGAGWRNDSAFDELPHTLSHVGTGYYEGDSGDHDCGDDDDGDVRYTFSSADRDGGRPTATSIGDPTNMGSVWNAIGNVVLPKGVWDGRNMRV